MGIIVKKVAVSTIDWPVKNARIVVENNIGEKEAIHIHILKEKPAGWAFRLHFTLEEFKEFSNAVISGGKL